MPDWSLHYLERITTAAERTARNSLRTRRQLEAVSRQVEELIGWVKRIALAAMLWGSGGLLTLNAEQLAELLVALIKR